MIEEMERKFRLTVKEFFLEPQKLVKYIKAGLITIDQMVDFCKNINSFNKKTCPCCRDFDHSKLNDLNFNSLPAWLEPIVNITKYLINCEGH